MMINRVAESEPESESQAVGVLGWSRSRIPNNSGCPIESFLHHPSKLGIPVEMVQFLWKLLLKQRFLAVHHDFH